MEQRPRGTSAWHLALPRRCAHKQCVLSTEDWPRRRSFVLVARSTSQVIEQTNELTNKLPTKTSARTDFQRQRDRKRERERGREREMERAMERETTEILRERKEEREAERKGGMEREPGGKEGRGRERDNATRKPSQNGQGLTEKERPFARPGVDTSR